MATERSRAALMSSSARDSAAARSLWPRSAAARPSAIFWLRACMAPVIIGHTNFIVNQTRAPNTTICARIVALRFTRDTSGYCSRSANSGPERAGEGEKQRDAYADHRHRVQETRDDEHLDLQHRHQFGLARGAFQKLAAQQAEADCRTQRAHADQDRDCNRGHALDLRQTRYVTHVNSLKENERSNDRRRFRAPATDKLWSAS